MLLTKVYTTLYPHLCLAHVCVAVVEYSGILSTDKLTINPRTYVFTCNSTYRLFFVFLENVMFCLFMLSANNWGPDQTHNVCHSDGIPERSFTSKLILKTILRQKKHAKLPSRQ